MHFRAHAGTFLACSLVLLLATGLYQRVANPALEYHLEHSSVATPTPAVPSTSVASDTGAPLPIRPEDGEKLAQAMADLKKNPTNAQTNMLIANIFMQHRDWHNAVKFMERAVSAAPDDAAVWHSYGLILFGHKEYEKSTEAFERALALNPSDTSAMTNLIVLYRREPGNPERALELARAVLASPKADEHTKNIAKSELQRVQ